MRSSFRAVGQRPSQRRRPFASISLIQSRATPTHGWSKGARAAGVDSVRRTIRLSTSRPSRRLSWLQVKLQILFMNAPTHRDTGMQILAGARMAREVGLANLACDRLPCRSGALQQIAFGFQLHAHLQKVEFEAIKNPARWPGFVSHSSIRAGMTGWVNNATWRHDIASPFEGLFHAASLSSTPTASSMCCASTRASFTSDSKPSLMALFQRW